MIKSKTIIERNPHNVANYLKCIVNKLCEDVFKWYPEAEEEGAKMGLWDINYAIEILEQAEVEIATVESEEEHE